MLSALLTSCERRHVPSVGPTVGELTRLVAQAKLVNIVNIMHAVDALDVTADELKTAGVIEGERLQQLSFGLRKLAKDCC